MKIPLLLIAAFFAGTALATVVTAQDQVQKDKPAPPAKPATRESPRPAPGSRASGDRFIQVFISRNDRNGDGIVEKSEFQGSAARFDEMDTNRNGRLDSAELLPLFRSRLNDPRSMQERLRDQSGATPTKPQADGFTTTPDGRKVSGEFIFKRLDVDGDEKLTVAEFSKSPGIESLEKAGEIVARIDQNKDGQLARAEFGRVFQMRHGPGENATGGFTHPFLIAMGAKGRAGCTPEQLATYERVFAHLDADDDGSLTAKEYVEDGTYLTQEARAGIFRASDSNGDGTVTRAEYVENRIITDEAKAVVERADVDSDENITKAEFFKHPALTNEITAAEIFGQLDTNGDGKITTPEYLRVWGQWARESVSKVATTAIAPGAADGGTASRPPAQRPGGFPGGRPGFGRPPAGGSRNSGPPDPDVLFERFDRNKDGRLTKDEVPEGLWNRLSAVDTNKDAAVTKVEMNSRRQPPEQNRNKK